MSEQDIRAAQARVDEARASLESALTDRDAVLAKAIRSGMSVYRAAKVSGLTRRAVDLAVIRARE